LGLIVDTWKFLMNGDHMYKFTKRFALLKPKLKSLHHQHTSYITSCEIEAKNRWTAAQTVLEGSPQTNEYWQVERQLAKKFF
jgi:hypothetical protein